MNRRDFMGVGAAASVLSTGDFSVEGKGQETGEQRPSTRETPVKVYSRLSRLSPGSIAPAGWLLKFSQINADSWILNYARNRDPGVYSEYSRRSKTSHPVFNENNETIDFCGYIAYFGSALIHYAQLLPQSKVAQEVEPFVQSVLASQDADGYLEDSPPKRGGNTGWRFGRWRWFWTRCFIDSRPPGMHRYCVPRSALSRWQWTRGANPLPISIPPFSRAREFSWWEPRGIVCLHREGVVLDLCP